MIFGDFLKVFIVKKMFMFWLDLGPDLGWGRSPHNIVLKRLKQKRMNLIQQLIKSNNVFLMKTQ